MSFIVYLLLLSFALIPIFEIKIVSLISLMALFFRKTRFYSANASFIFLFILFSFAFIYSPYWLVFIRFPILKYTALALLFLGGILWAKNAASKFSVPAIKVDLKYLVFLTGLLYFINFLPLRADIPVGGDEQYHVKWLIDLFSYFQFIWQNRGVYIVELSLLAILLSLVFLLIGCYKFWPKLLGTNIIKAGILLFVPLSAALIYSQRIFSAQKEILNLSDVLRYPYFSKWINLVFILPQPFRDINVYRAVPFISLVMISWYLFYVFNKSFKNNVLSLVFSLSLTTIPIFLFYSSLLYLEMPLVLCLIICVFNLRKFIALSIEKLKEEPVWYILLFSTFIKEVALIILLLLITLRAIYQFNKLTATKTNERGLIKELILYLIILFPVLTYISFRLLFVRIHTPFFSIKNIFEVGNYIEVAKSNFIQLGALFVLGITGFLFLFLTKRKFILKTHSVLFLGFTLFFIGYYSLAYFSFGNESVFIGYSRWNLISVPVLISIVYVCSAALKNSQIMILIIVLFISNIALYPFQIGGIRFPNWGSPRADAAEYIYPYDTAVASLSETTDTKNILLFGNYQPYLGLRFYLEKYSFSPRIIEESISKNRIDKKTEQNLFESFMLKVSTDQAYSDIDTILYHSINNISLLANQNFRSFTLVKHVQNSQNSLYILKRRTDKLSADSNI